MKEFDGGLFASPMPVIVLGIDQSYSGFAVTAMAYNTDDALYHSWLFAGEGTGARRLINMRETLDGIAARLGMRTTIGDVAMEGYAPGAKFGREIAGELGGMVKTFVYDWWAIDPWCVAPMALKKYVTGKGTGVPKNVMLLKTFQKWGVEFHDDNVCDSYGLARITAGRSTLEYEREVIAKLKRS